MSIFARTGFITAPTLGLLALTACSQPADTNEQSLVEAPVTEAPPTMPDDPEVEPNGTVIEIRMSEIAGDLMAFDEPLVRAKVGDTIRFIPTAASHRAASIETMLPEGARGWEGAAGEVVSYVVPEPGIYGFQCVSHYAAGSVGLLIVKGVDENSPAATHNLDHAREADHPGRANPAFFDLFAEAERQGLLD